MRPSNTQAPKASGFVSRSDWRGGGALIRDYALIVGAAVLCEFYGNWIGYLATVWFIGLIQLGLGETLTHEASHFKLFKTRRFNRWSEWLCCYPFGFTLSDYRREHIEHHQLLNTNREQLHQDYSSHGLLKPERNMVWLWFFKPVLGYAAFAYLSSLIELATRKSAPGILFFWMALIGVSAWGGWLDALFLYWVIPMLWSYASFFYWSEIEDHFNTRTGTRTNIGWNNWLTHNNGYHAVHHRYPAIPWYRLKEAHYALCDDTSDISRGFLDTFRQISSNQTGESQNRPRLGQPVAVNS